MLGAPDGLGPGIRCTFRPRTADADHRPLTGEGMFSPSVRSRWATAMPAVAMMLRTLVAPAGAAWGGPADARSGLPLNRGVDQRVADFTLKDVASERPVSLYSFVGKKAIVLVFLGTDCPVGNL